MFHNNNSLPLIPTIVLLKPGDVLYIPPLYFHSVVSITPSYSVNAWTEDKKEAKHVHDIFNEKLPRVLLNKEISKETTKIHANQKAI